ncbi:uncharacterized protein LOC117891318 [Drosophila subobscura]|uniref:uncharacterized protein LOC117891318 n=1 Tax=Drosophila subobscura TaxID=7241 RepID=UPI00155AC384|nr:uncharacterized protein LOC117891318 [Drosophila subobscura]
MGCSSTKSAATLDDIKAQPVSAGSHRMASQKAYPASEAFTIPLDSEAQPELPLNETLRQPPKRIQQIMQEAAHTEPPTLEELHDKQQRAEQRRQELLQQKLETIQKNTQMLLRGHGGEGEGQTEVQPEERE